MPTLPPRQKGVALITVILIVSIVTVVASAMAYQQNLEIRRSSNLFERQQAYLYVQGAEQLAMNILMQDKLDNENDNLSEEWLSAVAFPVEGGTISGQLVDLNRRINLNNLVDANGEHSIIDIDRLKRLFLILGLSDGLVDSIVDWIDPDDNPFGFGAEENDYLGGERPYRTPNSKMASVSELLLIQGFDQDVLSKIEKFITVAPDYIKINVNTAEPEVLASLCKDLELADGDQLYDGQHEKLETFLSENLWVPCNNPEIEATLSVESDYFLLSSAATFGKGHVELYSVLKRDNQGKVSVKMRSQGVN